MRWWLTSEAEVAAAGKRYRSRWARLQFALGYLLTLPLKCHIRSHFESEGSVTDSLPAWQHNLEKKRLWSCDLRGNCKLLDHHDFIFFPLNVFISYRVLKKKTIIPGIVLADHLWAWHNHRPELFRPIIWSLFYHAEYFLSRGLHSLGKLPACLWGAISSPPPAVLLQSDGRKGHLWVSSSPLCHSPSSCPGKPLFLPLPLHLFISPVSPASGIFVSLPHCGCK